MFGITYWRVFTAQVIRAMNHKFIYGVKLATLPEQGEQVVPRIQVWAVFQELAGVHCMEKYVLPIWYFTHLTECTFMSPYFIVSVRVILNPFTCILHLNLHMWACLSLKWERHAGINHCRHFDLVGSHTSPILLCLRILCLDMAWVWWQRFLVSGRREERGLCWAGCGTD